LHPQSISGITYTMKYSICNYGNPILREKAVRISDFGEELKALAADMLETMYAEKGIGLAAQQIGRTEDLCVIDIPPDGDLSPEGLPMNPEVRMPLVLINAEIVESAQEVSPFEEGCLSFPDILGSVTRPEEVRVRYQDLSGEEQEWTARGLLARAVQHELDHLRGILFIDYMSQVRRMALAGRLKRLKKETLASLSEKA
jgi:peptide deformylase